MNVCMCEYISVDVYISVTVVISVYISECQYIENTAISTHRICICRQVCGQCILSTCIESIHMKSCMEIPFRDLIPVRLLHIVKNRNQSATV